MSTASAIYVAGRSADGAAPRFSACSETRGWKNPTSAHQISLQNSTIRRAIHPIRHLQPTGLGFRQGQRPIIGSPDSFSGSIQAAHVRSSAFLADLAISSANRSGIPPDVIAESFRAEQCGTIQSGLATATSSISTKFDHSYGAADDVARASRQYLAGAGETGSRSQAAAASEMG